MYQGAAWPERLECLFSLERIENRDSLKVLSSLKHNRLVHGFGETKKKKSGFLFAYLSIGLLIVYRVPRQRRNDIQCVTPNISPL